MNNKICKFYEDATIFDLDFNEIEYKYCNLFDDECKKAIKTKYCPYKLNKKLNSCKEKLNYYKQALEEIREIAEDNCTQCFVIDNFTKPDDCGICEWARILKVISEVLDER